jgi:hypothetical protein
MLSWGFPKYWEQMLVLTVKYAFDTYALIRKKDCINENIYNLIDGYWSYVGQALLKNLTT